MAGIPHPLWCCFMVWKAQAKVIMHAHWQVISLPKGGILWWRIFALVVVWRYRARCFIMLEMRLNWHIICKFYNSNLPQFMPSVYRLAVMPWQNIWVSMARMPLQIVPWLSLHLWIWQVHLLPWNACLVGISTRLIYSIPLSKKR